MTMNMTITPRLARTAGNSAIRSSLKFEKGSKLVVESFSSPTVREIQQTDVQIGRLLGKGGFCNVNEVVIYSDKEGERVYAIKYLRNSIMQQRDSLKVGAADLVVEAKILSHLSHPNIIELHGVSAGSLSDSYKHNHRFFLVVDLLTCSLEDMLLEWSFEEEALYKQNRLLPRFGLTQSQKSRLYERMRTVAIPVAKALKYLHEKNIVLRDLKPANIGFQGDTVKLFDFGMARELKEGRKLTGNTGSPLYMAPEVAMSRDYGLPADIYSFAYVLWELATLKLPFEGMTREKHTRKILVDDARPRVDNRCGSTRMQQLITECWDRSPKSRPSPLEILMVLNVETNRKLGDASQETRKGELMRKLPLARAA